ncbi:MAG: phosphonate C-P lyase system protein PhnG [Proteobacteria bacterium]|nr:phosphonate C-P lyase system protein PhnG [Pseudomonadota bacterium]
MTQRADISGGTAATADGTAKRRQWMSVLARASADEISARLEGCGTLPDCQILRGPETGLVMVRGRAGGGGAPFNLGEMTVTRCTLRTPEGTVGHAYIAGRDKDAARLAALVDALMQDSAKAKVLQARVIAPLAAAQRARREAIARKAAATKVQFFTMSSMRT